MMVPAARSSLLALCCFLLSSSIVRSEDPPPACQGGESFEFKVEGSVDSWYGAPIWQSDTLTINVCPYQYPPHTPIDVSVRTLMTVTAGETQGWSFGLEHHASSLQANGGDLTLTDVTTEGTDTATVQNGFPPDTDVTAIRPGYSGYTQGVVIDTNQNITLPPTTDFVTSLACYRLDVPPSIGTYPVTVTFTHEVGYPRVRSVITQDGQSNIPCVHNLTMTIDVNYYAPATATAIPASVSSLGAVAALPAGRSLCRQA